MWPYLCILTNPRYTQIQNVNPSSDFAAKCKKYLKNFKTELTLLVL